MTSNEVEIPVAANAVSALPSLETAPSSAAARRPSVPTTTTSRKSKKKKTQSSTGSGEPGAAGENTGRWTAEEHRLFLQGLEQHGKGWKKIASLIKSRTVVQIRTHAQKYFQKLAKARQNGEEGEVIMEGRGGVDTANLASSVVVAPSKRRQRQMAGTKRKAIQSVVASAQRQGKKLAAVTAAVPNPLPAVAPVLAHFILPAGGGSTASADGIPAPGTVSGPSLEDSLFRFLTPCPPSDPQVNDVARQAGANPIMVPKEKPSASVSADDGEISPTGVNDLSIYPSWTDAQDTPSWYAKGADVDALLDVADALDWIADSGDPSEQYEPPAMENVPSMPDIPTDVSQAGVDDEEEDLKPSTSVSTLPRVDSTNVETMVPSLPSLFHNESTDNLLASGGASIGNLKASLPSSASMLDAHLQVFENSMEEHAFVSTILENSAESTDNLASLE